MTFSQPLDPRPTSATYTIATDTLAIVFDQPLVDGVYAAADFLAFVQIGGVQVRCTQDGDVTVTGDTATLPMLQGLSGPTPGSWCNYTATGVPLVGTGGSYIRPFADLPVTPV
jgi:hypothetical protein